ncbi:MAG: DUF3604 domain-containing protein [Myxococcota bacterium]
MVSRILGVGLAILAIGLLFVWGAGKGWFGSHEGPGEIAGKRLSDARVTARSEADRAAGTALGARPKQVLFGDLHVHTTFSFDAFMFSLPMGGGEGAHPPADACDFARHCSGLDFWSINDHAFSITQRHWRETIDSIRQCNEVAGDPSNPDVVAYLGWEWTQVGTRPENHYGHKNVVLQHLDDARIPTRPIAALRSVNLPAPSLGLGVAALAVGGRMHDLAYYFAERTGRALCDPDTPVRDLPLECLEAAATPAELFRKLDDWGHSSLVIPHGTTWGFYTPPGSSWDKQLAGSMHDPDRQRLIEVYSGHGDSEVYRDFRAVRFDEAGQPECPPPTDDYLPTCWRAGEIIRERCLAAGESDGECDERATTARAHAAAAGVAPHLTVPGSRPEEWLDAGQCLDCNQPSFNYRPASSAQYIAGLGNFDPEAADAKPRRFRLGFMASSDTHFARAGTGYKEIHRRGMTDAQDIAGDNEGLALLTGGGSEEPVPVSRPFDVDAPGFNVFEMERQTSFLGTGGLIAVHAAGRDRDAIWDAMQRREVYGTSGPRMLLWFDLLNPPGSRGQTIPMGGEAEMSDAPVFQVRAVGSFQQKPGCPEDTLAALGEERMEHLCKGECYFPDDERRPITRIEIVRIRPQTAPGQEMGTRIDDPWRVITCEADPVGCVATVLDPEFATLGQDVLYYARAYEAEKPAINAGNLRCTRDDAGRCTGVDLCDGSEGDGDCLAPHAPRAWSSPIYLDFAALPETTEAP